MISIFSLITNCARVFYYFDRKTSKDDMPLEMSVTLLVLFFFLRWFFYPINSRGSPLMMAFARRVSTRIRS